MIAFGIIGGLAAFAGVIGMVMTGGSGLFMLILFVAGIVGGPRLVIKGIHQKAEDVKARREVTSPQLP